MSDLRKRRGEIGKITLVDTRPIHISIYNTSPHSAISLSLFLCCSEEPRWHNCLISILLRQIVNTHCNHSPAILLSFFLLHYVEEWGEVTFHRHCISQLGCKSILYILAIHVFYTKAIHSTARAVALSKLAPSPSTMCNTKKGSTLSSLGTAVWMNAPSSPSMPNANSSLTSSHSDPLAPFHAAQARNFRWSHHHGPTELPSPPPPYTTCSLSVVHH